MNPRIATPSLEPLLTAREVAHLLGVPLSWVYDNVGQLPTFRIGRSLRFRAVEIEDWVEAQRQPQPGPRQEDARRPGERRVS
ncbi:DNA binding domain-containing protein, excisionase family [Quadrisphaera granulorum]|uniref:Excisionase family DNA binding protein n=1 Tax=Quadrisphaera granulorum TaxID=317664 RepID=A0A315ZQM9_9ACTN|nr:helix-turn-helix domain-containing protein [Quadrisphaera granulorum]PWJ47609.1 excisionase family DNA binding protein [Quadrisphaera granulorum]SZE98739.1 DNA binding domain-containing protein, excisionase family [Quadrisphaera granulorum]